MGIQRKIKINRMSLKELLSSLDLGNLHRRHASTYAHPYAHPYRAQHSRQLLICVWGLRRVLHCVGRVRSVGWWGNVRSRIVVAGSYASTSASLTTFWPLLEYLTELRVVAGAFRVMSADVSTADCKFDRSHHSKRAGRKRTFGDCQAWDTCALDLGRTGKRSQATCERARVESSHSFA